MPTQTLPTTTSFVDQNWFLEPLKGADRPRNYLDRFAVEVYNVNPESHLARFLYVLIGPSGVGQIRQQSLEARLKLEELGLELFDLDAFYGSPLGFTRLLEELYDDDSLGLIDREAWDKIRARDAQYRSRVMDFLDAARAGGTPLGMEMAARSGLGHEVTIVENYKYLFDQYSDDPLGIQKYGTTALPEEFVVLPRRELPHSEVQVITITGSPTGGTFTLTFNGSTTAGIARNATASVVQSALEALPNILPGDIEVTGGTLPDNPVYVQFMGALGGQDLPQMIFVSSMTGGTSPTGTVTTVESGVDATERASFIPERNKHHLQTAIDRLRPQNTVPSFRESKGTRARTLYNTAFATSEYDEVVRYVTGSGAVAWPSRTGYSWIEANVEHASPKAFQDRQYQYLGFHNVQGVSTYDEDDNPSAHLGPFNEHQIGPFPFLKEFATVGQFKADMVLNDYAEPLTVRSVVENEATGQSAQLINGIYPTSYAGLPGVPPVQYDYEQFWASRERSEGSDYIEIDLGGIRVVNYVQFEMTHKPVDIEITFDGLDSDDRLWLPVRYLSSSSSRAMSFVPEYQSPWQFLEYLFTNTARGLIYTRYLRIKLTRRNDEYSPFNGPDPDTYYPWSVDVRNLRIGRNVTNLT